MENANYFGCQGESPSGVSGEGGRAQKLALKQVSAHTMTGGLGGKEQGMSHLLLLNKPWSRAGVGSCCVSGDPTG